MYCYQKLHIIKTRKLYETIKMLKTTMYCEVLTWTFKKKKITLKLNHIPLIFLFILSFIQYLLQN